MRIYLDLYQEVLKNDDVENKSNTGDYVNPTKLPSQIKPTMVQEIILTKEKNQQIQ